MATTFMLTIPVIILMMVESALSEDTFTISVDNIFFTRINQVQLFIQPLLKAGPGLRYRISQSRKGELAGDQSLCYHQ
jgi:hypothetical protein